LDGALFNMRIAMIGHKRYGSREGGVEVVVTELARRMAALGHEVTCYDRSGSDVMTGDAASTQERVIDGVRVVPVKTIDKKGLAAASASYYATKAAIADKPDVIHYHAEGPCAMLPLAAKAGICTVATIHGLDWQRAKWGKLGSAYIKHGEKAAAEKADEIIVLSRSVQTYFKDTYGRDTRFVPNGVEPKTPLAAQIIKEKWGLSAGSYILFLGRLVPEKRPELLVEAFKKIDTGKRLVIAGGASDTSEYEKQLRSMAENDKRILFTGFVTGNTLAELYSNAYCYVLPSDVEGMPMSLLEAMAYRRCCVTSDIPECADVLEGHGMTFEKGDADALRAVLRNLLEAPKHVQQLGAEARRHVEESYGWDSVVAKTLAIYRGEK
jgi:glycosyltransferase involved in cell wall biosynthesis